MSEGISLSDYVDVRSSSSSASKRPVFTSRKLWVPCGARGVFGGQILGQSLHAASKTIRELGLHSQHCYFLLPALSSTPIEYHVEPLRDGRSYATRLVKAVQGGKVVFVMLASYTVPPVKLPKVGPEWTPFSFIPTTGDRIPAEGPDERETSAKNKGKAKQEAVSHSLAFALQMQQGTEASSSQPEPEAEGYGQRSGVEQPSQGGQTQTSGFADRYQLPFPDNLVPWTECVEEEVRWMDFMRQQGARLKGKRRNAVEEYIQVLSLAS